MEMAAVVVYVSASDCVTVIGPMWSQYASKLWYVKLKDDVPAPTTAKQYLMSFG